MPPKSSSSASKKKNSRGRPRGRPQRPPSPVVVSESGKEGDDVVQDSSDQSVEGTPEPPENVPESDSLNTKKRPAPEDNSDSEIEIVEHTVTKKTKVSVEPPALTKPKFKPADTKGKSSVKKSSSSTKNKTTLVEKDDLEEASAAASQKVSKLRRVEPASEDPSDNPQRGELPQCVLLPFSSNASASGDERMMDLDSLKANMLSKGDLLILDAALGFTYLSPFLNPTLASPDLVVIDKDHLVWEDSRANAVFFTTGCVSACNLIVPTTSGGTNGASVKKLLLFPIQDVFQAAIDFFGFKFKVSRVAGQINNAVVGYATKKEGQKMYSSGSNAMGSPKKNTLFSKPKSQSVAPIGGTFPVALSFTDNVPIYDATQGGFEFSQTDLEKIRELPLYQKGKKDLPPYAVVTVAYTSLKDTED